MYKKIYIFLIFFSLCSLVFASSAPKLQEKEEFETVPGQSIHTTLVRAVSDPDYLARIESIKKEVEALQTTLSWALEVVPCGVESNPGFFEYNIRAGLTRLFTRQFLGITDEKNSMGLAGLAVSLTGDSASLVMECLEIAKTAAGGVPFGNTAVAVLTVGWGIADLIYEANKGRDVTASDVAYFCSLSQIEKVTHAIAQALRQIYGKQTTALKKESVYLYAQSMVSTVELYLKNKRKNFPGGKSSCCPITPNEIFLALATGYAGKFQALLFLETEPTEQKKEIKNINLLLASPMKCDSSYLRLINREESMRDTYCYFKKFYTNGVYSEGFFEVNLDEYSREVFPEYIHLLQNKIDSDNGSKKEKFRKKLQRYNPEKKIWEDIERSEGK